MAMFTEYEEEVTNCLATSKAAGPSTQQGASSLAEAKDMLQQVGQGVAHQQYAAFREGRAK